MVGARDFQIYISGPYEFPEEAEFVGDIWQLDNKKEFWGVYEGPLAIYGSNDDYMYSRKDN
jgi:hypothetical protein